MKFPVIIKDGKSTITFTSNDHGTYESGAVCMSSLEDMMVRVNSGKASLVVSLRKDDINTLKSIAKAVNAGDRTLKDIAGECNYYKWQTNCQKASAIYGRLAECKTRKQFAAILETIEEAPRYFVADRVYKVSPAGFVTVWNNTGREWVDVELSIINLINMGATEADVNAYTTIPLATVSTDKGRWFVLVNANNNRQHLYEFHNEQDAVEYANRINGL